MNEQLLCKDCKHSFRPLSDLILLGLNSSHAYKCRLMFKESVPEPDPVRGTKIKPAHYESCTIARMDYVSANRKGTNCGPNGAWWQPKNKRDLFKLITRG